MGGQDVTGTKNEGFIVVYVMGSGRYTIAINDKVRITATRGDTNTVRVRPGSHKVSLQYLNEANSAPADIRVVVPRGGSVYLDAKTEDVAWWSVKQRAILMLVGPHAPAIAPGKVVRDSIRRAKSRLPGNASSSGVSDSRTSVARPHGPLAVRRITGTTRREVYIANEVREIDNSRSVSPAVRTFTLSREWTQSIHVDTDATTTLSGGGNVNIARVISARMDVSTALKKHYSKSGEDKSTFVDQVVVTTAPFT
jgi:hypothetical protein